MMSGGKERNSGRSCGSAAVCQARRIAANIAKLPELTVLPLLVTINAGGNERSVLPLLVYTTPHLLRLLPAQPPQDRVCLDCD